MLTRQWQLGELTAEDTGTLVFANLRYRCTHLQQPGESPLEARIERQPLFGDPAEVATHLPVRVQMGQYWLKLLSGDAQLRELKGRFIRLYPLQADAKQSVEVRQYVALCQGRCLDGYLFFTAADPFAAMDDAQRPRLKALFDRFRAWYVAQYEQPATPADDQQPATPAEDLQPATPAHQWLASRLKYAALPLATVPGGQGVVQKALRVTEYSHGQLDWYDFELFSPSTGPMPPAGVTEIREYRHGTPGAKALLPAPVRFDGMPESRFWAFEDGGTNFAAVDADPKDLAKLALIEFALIYSGDWSLLNLEVPVGSYVEIQSLEVVDSFGRTTQVPALKADNWGFLSLGKQEGSSQTAPDRGLLIPPAAGSSLQGRALEEVQFRRDEMVNLVWGIETIVPSAFGSGKPGREQEPERPLLKANGNALQYRKLSAFPPNWIPFQPVQSAAGHLLLRRAAIRDRASEPVRPRTTLLRQGIGADDRWKKHYDIESSEIGRAGVIVRKAFQRSRDADGRVYVWLGLERHTGTGEGSSGLLFDDVEASD
jgi:hypothetical protein